MTDPANPPAGWYDDGRGALRYWDGTQWTEHTAPLAPADQGATAAYPATPADQTPTAVYGTAPLADQAPTQQYSAQPYGAAPSGAAAYGTTTTMSPPPAPGAGGEPSGPNVVGIIGFVVAVVGFVFACIPFVQVVAWILLPIGFILSIVGLFLKGRKWPAITGLIVSIVGAIVGAVVAAVVVFNVFGQLVDSGVIQEEIREGLESEFGTPVPTESATEAPEESVAPTEGLAFGDTMEWEDGVTMTVSAPEPFTPSDLAAGADQAEDLVFTLTITNGSTENVQPVVLSTLSSGGTEATRIIDVGAEGGQVGIPPTTPILPGESITWQEAWSVADAGSLTMQTAPSFSYETVVFTNAG
ncbi:DUF2510 domain-containing protein [Agromyces aurantiacus]|uniref:DUF2510 domain-containing protein n=1 Tax=Agromyces aurantiacus TaxID=165814 RepID=A0ABV9R6U9_9MICO|nr:DUF2510 domain-containing protein [Agromyces aurantiacus]MBM7503899.1 hypothetical protein [Agromyces aurantiacus]